MNQDFVLRVIADHFGVPVGEVAAQSVLTRDLGADSLDLVELTLRIENEFDIQIDDDEAEACHEVGDVLRIVGRLLEGGGQRPAFG